MPAILFTTLLTLSALYLPQPLLPVLTAEFGISQETAALLTTVSFVPLSLAPLFYGALLETISARRMLRVSVLLLAVTEVLVFITQSFELLILLRLIQGLLIPAILTALMTYTSLAAKQGEVERAMSWYIAATILGGFAGRAFSGLIAGMLHWRFSFLLLGASLLAAWWWLGRIPDAGKVKSAKVRFSLILSLLKQPVARTVYLMVFCFFLVFAAMMNYLPFRLTELSPGVDEFRIGMAYSGYLMGIVASLNAVRIQRYCGGAAPTMVVGLALFVVALAVMLPPSLYALLGGMFLLCGASFLTHATATGFLNRHLDSHHGTVNGLYVSFYYGGGAIGSWLPGYLYHDFGWSGFMLALIGVVLTALMLAVTLLRRC
ncbi:MAG: MFS transporter [Desulfuromonadales bacterium]|nr:MFS transporter [Desulfuromonadales bacterium]